MRYNYFTIFLCFWSLLTFGQDFSVKEVTFKNDTIRLYADVFTPNPSRDIKTGIALIQGSGDSGRSNSWARAFAEFLANVGYYVLLPDKRGSGKSEGDWKKASFEELAQDALASFTFFKKEYGLEKAGIMGLSQGGHIAPLVASKDRSVNFVIDISGASVPLFEQILHEVVNTSKKEGLAPRQIGEVLKLHALMKMYIQDGDWEPLGQMYDQLKSSDWSEFAATFPNQPDSWVWSWIGMNGNFDPLPYWKRIDQDVFIAYGARDEDDNVPVYESVYLLHDTFTQNGKTNYTIKIYDTGHALYEDDKAEIRKEFIDDLLAWLNAL